VFEGFFLDAALEFSRIDTLLQNGACPASAGFRSINHLLIILVRRGLRDSVEAIEEEHRSKHRVQVMSVFL